MPHVTGAFTVTLKPLDDPDTADGTTISRMSIDKVFEGPLAGTSRGQMLSARSAVKGSAGYVAIERVTGSLDGRSGSFVLQHSGLASRGDQSLTLVVVPDTGSGELEGLAGTMTITIAEGRHYYGFDYSRLSD